MHKYTLVANPCPQIRKQTLREGKCGPLKPFTVAKTPKY